MMAVVRVLYISEDLAAILVNWFGVEDGVNWGNNLGRSQDSSHVGSGTDIDFIFPSK
jgi:hypothetical protein